MLRRRSSAAGGLDFCAFLCYNTYMTTGDFVRARKHLFWSTKNYDGLSHAAIIEAVLNYGDMKDFRELIDLLGIKEVAKVFYADTSPSRMRINYFPEVKNYFQLYFQKYA